MQIPMRIGRPMDNRDRDGATPAAVISYDYYEILRAATAVKSCGA
jgi:hypothetical protein